MNRNLVVLGAAITAIAAGLFWFVSSQPNTRECISDCGLIFGDNLYLTSLGPITLGTLGVWLLVVGLIRKKQRVPKAEA
jgi:hypothetical protein